MVRCKHCPIIDECNKNPIAVNVPDSKGKPVQRRLCPLVILLARMNSKEDR
jgi:hypothetical protein